jgi:DNA helicase-2/ATP-dependent DNA helicase PcrA
VVGPVDPVRALAWDRGLEGVARRIAELDQSPFRVLAGPGTGKTFALIRRVARILQQGGVDPRRLLVSSFTRTSASDTKKELGQLGIREVADLKTGTVHSICFELLSKADVLAHTHRHPRPLLKVEEKFLVSDLHDVRFGGIRDREKRLRAFSAAWARLQSDAAGWPPDAVDREFHGMLMEWLRFHKAILIGELVPEALRYLRDNPLCEERAAFDHVLVDEYQDLNRAEQEVLDLLVGTGKLLVIGDENQSIYSFKHAHPDGIADFNDSHPNTHDETLDTCRRCPKLVVTLANALIVNNTDRADRPLNAADGNPDGVVHVVQWPSMEDEADGLARYIKERIDAREAQPGKVLVLAPRRQIGYLIRDRLKALDVPAHSFFHEEALEGNPRKFEENQAQQAFSLLTLLVHPEDAVSLRCWCGFGSSSLRRHAWKRLQAHCIEGGETLVAALARVASGELELPYAQGLVERYALLQEKRGQIRDLRGDELVEALFPKNMEWAEPLRDLAEGIQEEGYEAPKLLEVVRGGITQPELPTDVDYVRVMSLHKSKGLTADLVVLAGCVEGLVPFQDDDETAAEQARSLEEQRRLFYVGITRTKKILVLSSMLRLPRNIAFKMGARVQGGNRTHGNTIASPFLAELGPRRPAAVAGTTLLPAPGHS